MAIHILRRCSAFLVQTLLIISSFITRSKTANILFVPGNVKSHLSFFGALGPWLVQRGHNVTSIHASTLSIPRAYMDSGMHIETYTMDRIPYVNTHMAVRDAFTWSLNFSLSNVAAISNRMGENFEYECSQMFKDKLFMRKMMSGAFDIAISDNFPCFVSMAYKLSIPTIMFGTHCDPVLYRLPYNPAYIPHIMLSYTVPMNLIGRMTNFLMYATNSFGQNMPMNHIVKTYVPEKPLKNYFDIMADSVLCLQLRDPDVLSYVSPSMPNVVDVAGLMAKPAKSLPTHLESLISFNNTYADNGVILVSFGSWVNEMPIPLLQKLFAAFKKLRQLVILKYSRRLALPAPDNVKIMDWVPQNDLLGHHSVKLFISHCGVGSLIEAVHHGVPVLAVPLMFDQHHNAGIVKTRGYGEIIDLSNFTPEHLAEKAQLVMNSHYYRRNVRLASQILKEKESFVASGERAAFRIEHVIKYGGKHLRSNAFELYWYQYMMLDMALILICTILVTLYVISYISKCFISVLCYIYRFYRSTVQKSVKID